MKSRSKFRFGAAVLGFLALVSGIPAVLILAYAIAKALMPYNEEGNYYDGIVVHHAGNEYFYGLLSLLLGVLAVIAAVRAYRNLKLASASHSGIQSEKSSSRGSTD